MPRQTYRYSSDFKLKVVTEIESGKYTIAEARRIYDINGGETIPKWINKIGKTHLLNKVVRIQMKDEKDKIKELKNQIKVLERALTKTQVDNLCWQSLVEVIDEKYHIDSKKTLVRSCPKSFRPFSKNCRENYSGNYLSFFRTVTTGIL